MIIKYITGYLGDEGHPHLHAVWILLKTNVNI